MMMPTLHLRLLGDFGLIYADTHTLHWHPVTPFHLDVAEFEQALTEAEADTRRSDRRALQTSLEQADTLYRGELLPGCYDEWILPERERLRLRYMQALEHLLRLFEEQGDTVTAIRYAQRLLGLDPLSEDRYRRLMRLFALKNDRAGALCKCPRRIAYYLGRLTVKGTPAIQSTARSTQVSRARVRAKLKELKGYEWVSALKDENRPLRWRCADSSAILTLRFSCTCVTQVVYSW